MTAATTPDTAGDVAAIRAFNRFYTARVGALRDGLLATAHPLPEARVLYELGQVDRADFADLRRALDLDAGYLSHPRRALRHGDRHPARRPRRGRPPPPARRAADRPRRPRRRAGAGGLRAPRPGTGRL